MKYYATLLDAEEAKKMSLGLEDIIEPVLQKTVVHQMLWGSGDTEDESIKDAIKNLVNSGIITTYECESGAPEIIKTNDGDTALRHLWIHQNDAMDEPMLFPLPCHDTLLDFCSRYRLPEKAKQELVCFFKSFLHTES